jgi:hypothetical protein
VSEIDTTRLAPSGKGEPLQTRFLPAGTQDVLYAVSCGEQSRASYRKASWPSVNRSRRTLGLLVGGSV